MRVICAHLNNNAINEVRVICPLRIHGLRSLLLSCFKSTSKFKLFSNDLFVYFISFYFCPFRLVIIRKYRCFITAQIKVELQLHNKYYCRNRIIFRRLYILYSKIIKYIHINKSMIQALQGNAVVVVRPTSSSAALATSII